MKSILFIAFSFISIGAFAQINRFSTPVPTAQYDAMSFDELARIAQMKRAAYDQNQDYLYTMKKALLELKTHISEKRFLNRINAEYSYLTSLEDTDLSKAGKILKQREIKILEIIVDYKQYMDSNRKNLTEPKPKTIKNPLSSEEYVQKAIAELEAQNYQKAFHLSSSAIKADSINATAYYVRGYIYYWGYNNYWGALEDFTRALQLNSSLLDAAYYKGFCEYNIGKYEEAVQTLTSYLQKDDTNKSGDSYFLRGLAKIKLNQKIEGCNDLSMAGELGVAKAYEKIQEMCNK